jgi:uncharacterized protein (DUF1697 family)
MAIVVLLKGVNVGGHRTFRPSMLAQQLKRLDVVNIGAAGTFVIRKPVGKTQLRAELARRLPFQTQVVICEGRDILRLTAVDRFAGQPSAKEVLQFVSVLAKRRKPPCPVPFDLPAEGRWGLKVLECRDQFVIGLHRREMKAISYLGHLEKIFGVPATTRNWNTMLTIARVLKAQ